MTETIEWVDIEDRRPMPGDSVLVWGSLRVIGQTLARGSCFGMSTYSRGSFDVETQGRALLKHVVTHWAEIKGPT